MEEGSAGRAGHILWKLCNFLRKCIFCVLSVGPIPTHIAVIMDGNRRYAKKWNLEEVAGHNAGCWALLRMVIYFCELGVKYVTVYAFSIDNFKRRPEEVQVIMDLMMEKIEFLARKDSIVNRYGVKVHFVGNLKLLGESFSEAAKKLMEVTANNSNAVLSVCVAYTSTNEIMHAIQESCEEKQYDAQELINGSVGEINNCQTENLINIVDIAKHMSMAIAPDPDILIRSSGESRLSNFLLWQTAYSHLYSPFALWPEIGFWHLVWAVLNYQRHHSYLEKKKKKQL